PARACPPASTACHQESSAQVTSLQVNNAGTLGYCPGGRWGWGELAVCDGEKYPDGSFWHQWMETYMTGPQFYYDCVGGDEPLPGPPPPGGCDGAIPPADPPPPADAPPPAN
ncbi:hypothetical protein, partial [Mycobacterium marinum]